MNTNGTGYNPMRWDCEKQGCFNTVCRPKIEVFAECLPRRIAFTDVDGMVEIKGNFLFLEWKTKSPTVPTGQAIAFRHLVQRLNATILIVRGNAETMQVYEWGVWTQQKEGILEMGNLDDVKGYIQRWSEWADRNAR